jgi:hypothetical protein
MKHLLHIMLACALATLSACNTGKNLGIPKDRLEKTWQVIVEEILPEVESLLNVGGLPGVNEESQYVLGVQLRLCSVEESATQRRVVLLMTSALEGTAKDEISHLFTSYPNSKDWQLRSAWRTRSNGVRELIDISRSRRGQKPNSNLKGSNGSSLDLRQPDFVSHFGSSLKIDQGDTVQLNSAVVYFSELAQSGRLPYVKAGEWDRFSLLPLSNVHPNMTPRIAQFLIPLKDRTADFVYLFRESVEQNAWVLSSVLKLKPDGAAVMLPVK